MGEVCLEARQSMVARGKMPPSAHEFALRDMAFSLGDGFSLARHEPGRTASAALFFPGCQLAGSSPDHVVAAYQQLRAADPGRGRALPRLLRRAGPLGGTGGAVPGRAPLDFEETWERMGRPRVVTACSSCHLVFRGALQGSRSSPSGPCSSRPRRADRELPRRDLALHDPCTHPERPRGPGWRAAPAGAAGRRGVSSSTIAVSRPAAALAGWRGSPTRRWWRRLSGAGL